MSENSLERCKAAIAAMDGAAYALRDALVSSNNAAHHEQLRRALDNRTKEAQVACEAHCREQIRTLPAAGERAVAYMDAVFDGNAVWAEIPEAERKWVPTPAGVSAVLDAVARIARRTEASPTPAPGFVVPEGMVLVPREPTEAMVAQFWTVATGADWTAGPMRLTKRQLARATNAYRAMLASAPAAGGEGDGNG